MNTRCSGRVSHRVLARITRAGLLLMWFALPASGMAMNDEPVEFIRSITAQVLAEFERTPEMKSDTDKLHAMIEEKISPNIDYQRLSRLTLGKYWRKASQAQREQFTRNFRKLLVKTYASSLSQYTDQNIDYQLLKKEAKGQRVTVRAKLTGATGAPIIVDYRLHHAGKHWMIYDLTVEGVSLAVNYRSSFNEEISQYGLDGFIRHLAEQVRD